MAVSIAGINIQYGPLWIRDTDADNTGQINIAGRPGKVKSVLIDNTANAAISYLKLYDVEDTLTVGTTVPKDILPVGVSGMIRYNWTNGATFSTGLSWACVTAPGTAGNTSPTSNVTVHIIFE